MVRLTAHKVWIKDIINGKYFQVDDRWEPNYLITPRGRKISRIRIIGVVVNKFTNDESTYASITLDDTTDTIRIKAWEADVAKLDSINIGKTIDLIGKVKEYGDELYIVPEVIVPLKDHNWELVRRLELLKIYLSHEKIRELVLNDKSEFDSPATLRETLHSRYGLDPDIIDAVLLSEKTDDLPQEGENDDEEASKDSGEAKRAMLTLIDELDDGAGVSYSDLEAKATIDKTQVEDIIRELITEGEIFEPRTGIFKRLM